MMKKPLLFFVGPAVMLIANVAFANQVLYVDAAAPGADPNNTWADLSPSQYDFANDGAIYNAANKSYQFVDGSSLVGIGDESIYDFDTAKGTGADPFTVVAYFLITTPYDSTHWPCPLSKSESYTDPGAADSGWGIAPRSIYPGNGLIRVGAHLSHNGYWGADAAYTQVTKFDYSPVDAWSMVMVTFDGSGTAAGDPILHRRQCYPGYHRPIHGGWPNRFDIERRAVTYWRRSAYEYGLRFLRRDWLYRGLGRSTARQLQRIALERRRSGTCAGAFDVGIYLHGHTECVDLFLA